MKIGSKKVSERDGRQSDEFQEFVATLGKLKKGQSFVLKEIRGHYRVAISVAQTLLNAEFATRKEGNKYRIGRIK